VNARDELQILQELDAHRPGHREYEGGWWELSCAGCDAFKGRRLSHLDWAPYREHRTEVFHEALAAAGYRKPCTITTTEELDEMPEGSMVRTDTGFYLKEALRHGISTWVTTNERWYFKTEDIALPATVLYEGGAS
jgi:hypothetical protein